MEGVPYLRIGKGERPQNGGCILQVISWLDHGGWDDNPHCVLGPLRTLAIDANDNMRDEERQGLLDLAPRLRGTAHAALFDNAGKIIRGLTPEQEEFNRWAQSWMACWMDANQRGHVPGEGDSGECDDQDCSCHEECESYIEFPESALEYLTRALDAYEAKFGKQKPMWFDSIDWKPIYNYLKQIENDPLWAENARRHGDVDRLTARR